MLAAISCDSSASLDDTNIPLLAHFVVDRLKNIDLIFD
jgi:hypothetical protein